MTSLWDDEGDSDNKSRLFSLLSDITASKQNSAEYTKELNF